jgi:precorrin-2 dehydrogenase/sirohydrochlorin ferrochelatase
VKFYPVFLNLKNKKCLIVGGGKVAERKVSKLLRAGARVWVISPILSRTLKKMWRKKKISYIDSEYKKKFLDNAFLVIAATNDSYVNWRVYQDASQRGILVNSVDNLLHSNFIVPASFERGYLTVAVSTSAKAPFLARRVKEDLAKVIDAKYTLHLKVLENLRKKIKSKYSPQQQRRIFKKISRVPLSRLKQNTIVKKILK